MLRSRRAFELAGLALDLCEPDPLVSSEMRPDFDVRMSGGAVPLNACAWVMKVRACRRCRRHPPVAGMCDLLDLAGA